MVSRTKRKGRNLAVEVKKHISVCINHKVSLGPLVVDKEINSSSLL